MLEKKVEKLEQELDMKVQQSPQMKNMQKILKDKNEKIEELRKQLGQ